MKTIIKIAFLSITVIISSCCPDYEITIYNGNYNQIEINNRKFAEFICEQNVFEEKGYFILSLDSGINKFKIIMNDGSIVDTSIFISGEVYLGVDLENKTLIGF